MVLDLGLVPVVSNIKICLPQLIFQSNPCNCVTIKKKQEKLNLLLT